METPQRRACTLGMDLGTTGIKVVAFDANDQKAEPIAIVSRPSDLRRSADGAAELDPHEQFDSLHAALAEAVKQAHDHGYQVVRIGISCAMHSLLAVSDDGTPLTAILTWADLRAQPDAESLWASSDGRQLYERTGVPIHSMSPLAKLLWLRRTQPDVFSRAARFVGLKEWIWFRWFGEWKVDVSIASAMGLYNLREHRWDTQALSLAHINESRLPSLASTSYIRADILPAAIRAAGVDEGCALSLGSSDGVLANLGVHVTDGRRLVLTIGTSMAVRIGSQAIKTDAATRTFCYVVSEEQQLYALGAPSNNGGTVLEWMYHHSSAQSIPPGSDTANAGETPASFEAAMTAAGETPAPDGLYVLPYFDGERAPFWSTTASGGVIGLRSEHTARDLLRAAAEGVLFNARWIAEPFLLSESRPEAIIASGGGLKSPWMRQLAADIFGLPVYTVATIEASARGAATLADLATGAVSWDAVREPLPPASTATPDTASLQRYQARNEEFKRLALMLSPMQ